MRWVAVLVVSACGSTTFGHVVTDVSVSPTNAQILIVRSCELVSKKGDIEQVSIGACNGAAVRRSAITPVPVVDASVLRRDNRVITDFVERPAGGAIVTTCRIGKDGGAWKLLDCVKAEIATAPLEAAP
jgi:hypothetical protein